MSEPIKPFTVAEFQERIQAILRPPPAPKVDIVIYRVRLFVSDCGNFSADAQQMRLVLFARRKRIVKLILSHIVRMEAKHRTISDQRRRTNFVLASYRGEDGQEYRKGFESYTAPEIPQQGTHETLNALKLQFTQ